MLISCDSPDKKSPTYGGRPVAEPLHCSVLHSISLSQQPSNLQKPKQKYNSQYKHIINKFNFFVYTLFNLFWVGVLDFIDKREIE